jgi:ATP-dependent RNA/DNA helicase IGHMBP2
MNSQEELRKVQNLMKLEKEEEIKQYQLLMEQMSLNDRIKAGACWFPLEVENSGWSLGEHPFIVVSRNKMLNTPHKFRAGQVVGIFGEQFLEERKLTEFGVVHFVDKNKMKIIFYGTDLPSWVLRGRIGVQLAFDERSYIEMDRALKTVMEAKANRLAELREILLGKQPAYFEKTDYTIDIPHLNPSQNEAVMQILTAKDVAVVHGPPGTGKTTTLVEAIKQLAKRESPILVCAPSNPATDLLTERLAKVGLNVVRIGNISRVDEDLLKHTIEGILDDRPEMKEVKKMKIEAAQLFRQADKFTRNFGAKEREERRESRNEAKTLMQQARMLEDYVIEKILTEADVICCTLVSAMNRYIEKKKFHTVVIDEAAQALEPASWIPICKAEKVILAGDPFQLPPTVKSMEAAKGGLSVTLLEKAVDRLEKVQLLNVQYRMHELIMGFSNQEFYNNQLKAADFVAKWTLTMADGSDTRPVEFIDTAGCGFDEKVNPETLSSYNPEEYFVLRQHLDNLLTLASPDVRPSIAIISPYREQVQFIQEHIKKDFDHYPDDDITVDTIDSFQGQERDVVYITLVRSNPDGEIGFLKDTRRMNVAMTRAKKKLVVIGDSATLGGFKFYSRFLDYCEEHGCYGTAWEWS